jgi:uncharacterized protein (TIGR03086 family)
MADDILVRVVDELRQVVDGIRPDQMSAPTPCSEWDVRGVLNHVTGGSIMFAECVENGSISDEEFGRLTSTDLVGDQPSARFGAAADRALAAFGQPGALDRIVTLPFGTMPAGVAANIAVFDLTVHALDLARATGQSTTLDPDVLQAGWEAAQAMLSPELRAGGLFAPAQPCADDAPLADRLMAYSGRSV